MSTMAETVSPTATTLTIQGLFLSPGHNFFGHHGGPAGSHPMLPVAALDCVAGRGVRGDRFFDYKPDYNGQITFFSLEVFAALQRELGLPDARPEAARRNVLVTGVDLNALVGMEFTLQGVRFFGAEECRPCYWMDRALGPGSNEWMRGRGGLRARILSDGMIRATSPLGT
jgi:MOSC domain-containing protein YiiM